MFPINVRSVFLDDSLKISPMPHKNLCLDDSTSQSGRQQCRSESVYRSSCSLEASLSSRRRLSGCVSHRCKKMHSSAGVGREGMANLREARSPCRASSTARLMLFSLICAMTSPTSSRTPSFPNCFMISPSLYLASYLSSDKHSSSAIGGYTSQMKFSVSLFFPLKNSRFLFSAISLSITKSKNFSLFFNFSLIFANKSGEKKAIQTGFLIHSSLRMLGVIFGRPSHMRYSAISSLPAAISAQQALCSSDNPLPLSQIADLWTDFDSSDCAGSARFYVAGKIYGASLQKDRFGGFQSASEIAFGIGRWIGRQFYILISAKKYKLVILKEQDNQVIEEKIDRQNKQERKGVNTQKKIQQEEFSTGFFLITIKIFLQNFYTNKAVQTKRKNENFHNILRASHQASLKQVILYAFHSTSVHISFDDSACKQGQLIIRNGVALSAPSAPRAASGPADQRDHRGGDLPEEPQHQLHRADVGAEGGAAPRERAPLQHPRRARSCQAQAHRLLEVQGRGEARGQGDGALRRGHAVHVRAQPEQGRAGALLGGRLLGALPRGRRARQVSARTGQRVHAGSLHARRGGAFRPALRLHQLRHGQRGGALRPRPREPAAGVLPCQERLAMGGLRLVLEHEKRRIVEHWHEQIQRMHAQSKGNEIRLTGLLANADFYAERFETEDFFTRNCETGDVILFQDDHFFAKAQRFFTRSNFDHVGMVVKDTRYGLLVFEANSGSGVGLTPWRSVIRYGWYRSIPKDLLAQAQDQARQALQ